VQKDFTGLPAGFPRKIKINFLIANMAGFYLGK